MLKKIENSLSSRKQSVELNEEKAQIWIYETKTLK